MMNNYEYIKSLSMDEMKYFLMQKTYCDECPTNTYNDYNKCPLFTCKEKYLKIIEEWLKSEHRTFIKYIWGRE